MAKLLVRTSLGNSILDYGDIVPTFSANNKYFEKPAADLNIGERVLFEKEYITATLDDVEPFLIRSKRYAEAKNALHEINKQGRYIPLLRCLLWRGLQKGNPDLEAKILLEEQDFLGKEYSAGINTVQEAMTAVNMEPLTYSGTKNWLDGTTLAPDNWNKFGALERINPKFSSFKVDESNRQSLFFLYKLYTTVRRGVMHYLDKPNFKHSEEECKDEHKISRISLAEEIDLVLEHFVKDVNKDQALAQILQIDKIFEDEPTYKKARKENTLARGIVRGRGKISEVERFDLKDLFIEKAIALDLLLKIFNKLDSKFKIYSEEYSQKKTEEADSLIKRVNLMYVDDAFAKQELTSGSAKIHEDMITFAEQKKINPKEVQLELILNLIDNYLTVENETEFYDFLVSGKKASTYFNSEERKGIIRECLDEIMAGSFDQKLNIESGTIVKLLDMVKNYQRNLPKSFLALQKNLAMQRRLLTTLEILDETSYQTQLSSVEEALKHPAFKGYEHLKAADWATFRSNVKSEIEKLTQSNTKMLGNLKSNYFYFKDKTTEFVAQLLVKPDIMICSNDDIRKFLVQNNLTELAIFYPDIKPEDLTVFENSLNLEERIDAKIKRKSKEIKYGQRGFSPQVTEEHNKLVDFVVQNSGLIEPKLKFISKEYVFDVSNNRADILFIDAQNKPLVIEVEQNASDKTGKIGFSQAYIYKNLFMIDYDLPKENVRGMLIAKNICGNTKKLCEKYGIEFKEITLESKQIKV